MSNLSDLTGTVEAAATTQHTLTMDSSGRLEATLTWPTSSIDLDLYLTSSTCNGYPPRNCSILDSGRLASGTVERVSKSVSRGEAVKLWVDNFDATRRSSYRIALSLTNDF